MKIWYSNLLESDRFVALVESEQIRFGRGSHNDVVLDSPFVAEEAAVLQRRGGAWELFALGMNGCEVGGSRVAPGQRISLAADQSFNIFPFALSLQPPPEENLECPRTHFDAEMSQLIKAMHIQLLEAMDISARDEATSIGDERLLAIERNLDEIAISNRIADSAHGELTSHIAGVCVRSELVETVIQQVEQASTNAWSEGARWSRLVSAVPHLESELASMIRRIRTTMRLSDAQDLTDQMVTVESGFWTFWDDLAPKLFDEFRLYLAKRQLKKQIKDIVFGYGPLEDLLRTPTISEIMVVSSERIYIEKNGRIENSGRRFISDAVTLSIIERIVSKVGRRIDKSKPLVDARLADGSRVNAVIPPLAVSGPSLTIRKFPLHRLTIDDLIEKGALPRTAAEFLKACVLQRRNMLISGGTGTGKTTLLNCLSDYIPNKERIVTIEDTAELQLHKDHVVRLETKQTNAEGQGAYGIHELVKNALRMRPDRIVVGECRGAEALDMLQAMNTGHAGSLTTIHANNAQDVVLRLEVMVQGAAQLPLDSIHRQIGSALDLIVQLTRLRDGTRRVAQITEVVGYDDFRGGVRTKDIFRLEEEAGSAVLRPTGLIPGFMTDLLAADLVRLEDFFR